MYTKIGRPLTDVLSSQQRLFFQKFNHSLHIYPIQILIFFSKHTTQSLETLLHDVERIVTKSSFMCLNKPSYVLTQPLFHVPHKGMCVSQTNCQPATDDAIYSWSYHSQSWFHHHSCINDAFVCQCIILAIATAIIFGHIQLPTPTNIYFVYYVQYEALSLRFCIPNSNFYL